MLMYNRQMVVQDICNASGRGLKGGALTQQNLKRVPAAQQASVDAMIGEVIGRLFGNSSSVDGFMSSLFGGGAKTPEQARVWADAAGFLGGRIQGSPGECSGRAPDMSMVAAGELRKMLASME